MMPSVAELKLADFMQPCHKYECFVMKLDKSLLEAQHCFMSSLLGFLCDKVFMKAFDLDESIYLCKLELMHASDRDILLHLVVLKPGMKREVFYADVVNTDYFFSRNKLDGGARESMLRAELVMMYDCMHTLFSGVYEVDLKLKPEVILHEQKEFAGFTYTVEEEKTHTLQAVLPLFRTVEELLACFMVSGLDTTVLDNFGKVNMHMASSD